MSETSPPSTEEIILDRVFFNTSCERCVSWAVSELVQGNDGDYICRLAGQLGSEDLDTIKNLTDRALAEIGIDNVRSTTTLCRAVGNLLHAAGTDELQVTGVLGFAREIWIGEMQVEFEGLYRLSHGLEDLECYGAQWYIQGMDCSNCKEVAKSIVNKFIDEHASPF